MPEANNAVMKKYDVKKWEDSWLLSNSFGVDYLIESLIRFPVMQSCVGVEFSKKKFGFVIGLKAENGYV